MVRIWPRSTPAQPIGRRIVTASWCGSSSTHSTIPVALAQGEPHRLLTTLLDDKLDLTLIALYHERWEEDQTIDELKTHQRERPVLRSQTPGRGARVVRPDAGALHHSGADARSRGREWDRSAPALVHWGVEDPAVSIA